MLQYGVMTSAESLPAWVRQRVGGRRVGRGIERVLGALATQPRQMSFASAAEAASLSGVNAATVVRAAQLLGFSGWPALRSEMRSRYLSRLSASQVLSEHPTDGAGPAVSTLRRDAQNLQDLSLLLDEEQVRRVAGLIAAARTTLVLGSGSFAGPGLQLAHLAQTIGHDVRLQRVGGTALVNAVSLLSPGDCLVVLHLWRSPWEILTAMRIAAGAGVHVVVISDQARADLQEVAHELLPVPSEGASMFPSLVAATCVVQAVVASLVALDPAAAAAASDRTERRWAEMGLFPDP